MEEKRIRTFAPLNDHLAFGTPAPPKRPRQVGDHAILTCRDASVRLENQRITISVACRERISNEGERPYLELLACDVFPQKRSSVRPCAFASFMRLGLLTWMPDGSTSKAHRDVTEGTLCQGHAFDLGCLDQDRAALVRAVELGEKKHAHRVNQVAQSGNLTVTHFAYGSYQLPQIPII